MTELFIKRGKYKGDNFYCPFCKENCEVNIIPFRGGYKTGRFKNRGEYMYLCVKCGGKVFTQASKREIIPRIPGAMRIKR